MTERDGESAALVRGVFGNRPDFVRDLLNPAEDSTETAGAADAPEPPTNVVPREGATPSVVDTTERDFVRNIFAS